MHIVTLSTDKHYENPPCACDHHMHFDEIGEQAAPQELVDVIGRGFVLMPHDLAPPSVPWLSALLGITERELPSLRLTLHWLLKDDKGARFAVVAYKHDEVSCGGGHDNGIQYRETHLSIPLTEDTFQGICSLLTAHKWEQRRRALRGEAVKAAGIEPRDIDAARRRIWAEHGLDDDAVARKRKDVERLAGLDAATVAERVHKIEEKVAADIRAERAASS